ncbi:hypothetical protein GW920_03060 [Candidatus Falkowbacteria bacterium]|uniref:DHH family phosphoesterase n=1 Tax=Candidatus Falkowbacteria bacterium CG10_big_fil_rev_8_21_14_0_10_37_18 TaxID=1974562 RepID=A0A2H0V8E5_9BACT|nr:hypothetical protein [Candidatus Falkowbacteria bacterium]NCQ12970.1 hypothetical protein [Candidatus Falkowbacteria bacterium]OIO05350.1 MAG: hypothetical protein AUJ26_03505 [Candidatus Falkowbacteria bacterium CG1_02_37_21]PIR95338.1 MAG: hypothetical protein COT93_02890 [Candidatus Falkowbacteria bacterium CG10_big_fil_rev_8_21_14_0_10_37_18]
MNLSEKFNLAYTKMKAARKILIVGHISPDADALASVGAIIEIMHNIGSADIYAYADGKPQDDFNFIPNEKLISSLPPADLNIFDVIVILDCGSLVRTALATEIRELSRVGGADDPDATKPYIIEFDHHQPQETYADLEIRLPDKASTTEIIYGFLRANDLEITKPLANCIFIGLVTDTGHFFHTNSSPNALAVASEMLLFGAFLPTITNHTVNNKSFLTLKIWGRVLDNMFFNPDTGLLVSALSAKELKTLMLETDELKASTDLFGDIVSFLSTLQGVRVALLLREEGDRVKGSLRTGANNVDVAEIARSFGGGGHKKAAGFSLAGSLVKTTVGWNVK